MILIATQCSKQLSEQLDASVPEIEHSQGRQSLISNIFLPSYFVSSFSHLTLLPENRMHLTIKCSDVHLLKGLLCC